MLVLVANEQPLRVPGADWARYYARFFIQLYAQRNLVGVANDPSRSAIFDHGLLLFRPSRIVPTTPSGQSSGKASPARYWA